MDNVLMSCEIETYVEAMKPQQLTDIGSETWFDWHQRLQKLNQQAVIEASALKDESVKEALVTYGKASVLVHEAVTVDVWKRKVLPLLLRLEADPESTFVAYSVLYHEAIAVALLELVMYHESCAETLGDCAVDLLDYLVGAVSGLLAPGGGDAGAPSEIERQRDVLAFEVGIRSLTLIRYLSDCLGRFPLAVTVQMLNTYDAPVLLAQILLERPWLRDGKQYKACRWMDYDGESLIQCEAQVWLTLCQLVLNADCVSHYSVTGSRRSQLLKLQPLLTPTLLDQLSPLAALQRCLCHLAVSGKGAPAAPKAPLLELMPTIKRGILEQLGKKWKKVARAQLPVIFTRDRQALQKIARGLSDAYNTDLLEQFEAKVVAPATCSQCGKGAIQRCSRCKKQWYCSRNCQVLHWPQHKEECL